MIMLDRKQIKHLHTKLIEATGGLDGIRDETMLDSALFAVFQIFDGIELYPSVISKISRIDYSLVCNHLFIDGNKRIGVYVMLVLLELNNIEADFSDEGIIHIHRQLNVCYALLRHRGSYGSLAVSYGRLMAHIQEQGWTVCGDAYEGYIGERDDAHYVIEIVIEVSR